MKFYTLVNEILDEESDEKLGCHDAADEIVSILKQTQPNEIAGAVIEAINKCFTLDEEQTQALTSLYKIEFHSNQPDISEVEV